MANQKTPDFPVKEGGDAKAIADRCLEFLAQEENRTWSDRADDLLRSLLPKNDAQLKGLVLQAEETGGVDNVEELLYRLEQVSRERKFLLDGKPKKAILEIVPLTLYPGLIPVEEALKSDSPALGTASERVALGLELSGVRGPRSRFTGLPGVYAARELASLSFAEVADLLESGVAQVCTGTRAASKKKTSFSSESLSGKGDYLSPVTAAGRVLASAAYVVLVCVLDDEVMPMRATMESVSEQLERQERSLNWMLESAQVLEHAIGADILLEVVSLPQHYFEGFRAGVERTRDILLMASLSAHSGARGIDAGDIVARVWCGQQRADVRAAFLRSKTGEILGGVTLPVYPWETGEVACDSVESVLFESGVLGIQTAGDALMALKPNFQSPIDSVQGG